MKIQKITETQSTKRNVGDVIDWGDQIDIITHVSDEVKLDDSTVYDVSFVRVSKNDFENSDTESIIEEANTIDYEKPSIIKTKIENLKRATELLIEILEDEDEQ